MVGVSSYGITLIIIILGSENYLATLRNHYMCLSIGTQCCHC